MQETAFYSRFIMIFIIHSLIYSSFFNSFAFAEAEEKYAVPQGSGDTMLLFLVSESR